MKKPSGYLPKTCASCLLASPLGRKRVMAIDPGFKSGCKVVCLDEHGAFLKYQTIYPHAPQNDWDGAIKIIKRTGC